jgi:hypothetical protein
MNFWEAVDQINEQVAQGHDPAEISDIEKLRPHQRAHVGIKADLHDSLQREYIKNAMSLRAERLS